METWQIVLATLAGAVTLKIAGVALISGFRWHRITTATCAAWHCLVSSGAAERMQCVIHMPAAPVKPERSTEPLRILALLQRESRLVDLLMEDLTGCDDAQLGAGVRDVLAKARKTLREHVELEACMAGLENDPITVPAGFAPGSIVLTGQVTGEPPFQGTLRHPGWRVKDFKLPEPLKGQDGWVIGPAEVEVG